MLQNAALPRKSPLWCSNTSTSCVSCTAPAAQNASFQILLKCLTPVIVFETALKLLQNPMFCSLLTRCTIPCACHAKRHLNVQKCSVPWVFYTFDSEMCFAHLRATTAFTFSTSQLPKVFWAWCVHVDFQMCFAPQRRALFRHHNFQKWSKNGVLCTFWLPNMLRATTACNFSSLIWPHGSAPAALASLLFDPPEPHFFGKNEKTECFATFLPLRAPGSSFFWDFLFVDFLSSSLLFSGSSHLCFSSVHIVESLTSNFLRLSSIKCFSNITQQKPLFVILMSLGQFLGQCDPMPWTHFGSISGVWIVHVWAFPQE